MGIVSVNLLAVVVCAIVNMVLGALWYSPVLFANSWMNLIGKSKEEMSNPGPLYIVTAVVALVLAFFLAQVIVQTKTVGIGGGIVTAILIWIGFVATSTLPDYIFAGRPAKLYLINTSWVLVSMAIQGAILGAWV